MFVIVGHEHEIVCVPVFIIHNVVISLIKKVVSPRDIAGGINTLLACHIMPSRLYSRVPEPMDAFTTTESSVPPVQFTPRLVKVGNSFTATSVLHTDVQPLASVIITV